MIIMGACMLFLGNRYWLWIAPFQGFILGGSLIFLFIQAYVEYRELFTSYLQIFLVVVIFGSIFWALFAYYKLVPIASLGIYTGMLLSHEIMILVSYRGSFFYYYLFVNTIAISLGVLCLIYEKKSVIYASSLCGAIMFSSYLG